MKRGHPGTESVAYITSINPSDVTQEVRMCNVITN